MQRFLAPIVLALLCAGAYALMMAQALNHWRIGRWYLADMGNMWYCLVNTLHDDFMYSPMMVGNHFGYHFTPFLLILTPLIWLSRYPIPLAGAYNLALALTPVPLYLLARQAALPRVVALALGVWFLGNHFVGSVQLSYHFESFYILFALGAMAAWRGSRGWVFWTLLGLALSVKEDAVAWMAGWLALEAWLGDRALRRRALTGVGVCVVYGVAALGIMKWAAYGQSDDASVYLRRMGSLRLGLDTAWMMTLFVLSSGGLVLLNWRRALLLLIPAPMLLGTFFVTRDLLYYYSYPFLPFLGLATVAGTAAVWHKVTAREGAHRRRIAALLAVMLAGLGAAQYRLPTRTEGYKRQQERVTLRQKLRMRVAAEELPTTAPVAIQFGLWGVTPWRVGAVALSEKTLHDHHYVFLDFLSMPYGIPREEFRRIMARLEQQVESGERRMVYERNSFVIVGPVGAAPAAE